MNQIYFADNLPILQGLASDSVDLIYIDPPFNTGRPQTRTQIKANRSSNGDRKGFNGSKYETIKIGTMSFYDYFDDFMQLIRHYQG